MVVDRYVYPGTNVLVNKLGIRDANMLSTVERRFTALRTVDIFNAMGLGNVTPDSISSINRYLFQDLYDWAGAYRDIDIWKGGHRFLRHDSIVTELRRLCSYIDTLSPGNRADVVDGLSKVMVQLNMIHPFREGNGCTQRVFVALLARRFGYELGFGHVTEDDMRNASMAASRGQTNLMSYLIDAGLTGEGPDPSSSGDKCWFERLLARFGV